jgi:hypothetical protein
MVAVILTLLGLAYLTLADQENTIAMNQRDSDQLLFVAESGAQMVKAWFDRPTGGDPNSAIFKFMGDYDMRYKGYYDFTKRVYDHDGDANTPDVLASPTDPNRPLFRQGLLVGTDPNYLLMWDKPYRGSKVAEFRGTEAGPDVQMVSDPNVLDALDIFNSRVIGNRAMQEKVGRIQQVDVYAPPIINVNGVMTRYGLCTVKITASKFRRMSNTGIIPITNSGSVEMGRRVVKMVLNEVPYPGPSGPFTSCTAFDMQNSVKVHWGEIVGMGNGAVGPSSGTQIQGFTPYTIPWKSATRYLDPNDLTAWVTLNSGATTGGFDPWFKLRIGGAITGAPNTNMQPWPYAGPPAQAINTGDTEVFQFSPGQCPSFDYKTWRNVAMSGGQNIHYMTHTGGATADSWRENGFGPSQTLEAWTSGQEGFWFFETVDGLPPDPNGANLTPVVALSGAWTSAGFIYLNANWDSAGLGGGVPRVLIPPGEPWNDFDGDKIADPGEFVNLKYPTSLSGDFRPYTPGHASNPAQTGTVTSSNGVAYTYTTDPNNRDSQGVPFSDNIAFQGVLFVQGTFRFTGNLTIFGAMQTKGGMITGPNAGTPDVYFDERLIKGNWPPPELNLPRTAISFWQSEM